MARRTAAPSRPAGPLSIQPIGIHPAALEEAEAATDWYAQRSRRAAERFLDELERAIDQIARNPTQYASHELGTRRMLLRRFPFVIIFGTLPLAWRSSQSLIGVADRDTGATVWGNAWAFIGPNPYV